MVYAQSMIVSLFVIAFTFTMNAWNSLYLSLPEQKTLYLSYSVITTCLVLFPFLTVVTFVLSRTFKRSNFFFWVSFSCCYVDIAFFFLPLIMRKTKRCHHP